ncbi:uncharacterized protein LOC144116135 [Amblyomma americanum]
MGVFTDRYFAHQGQSSGEYACISGHYGSQEHSAVGAVGCIQQNGAGRPAAAGSASRPVSDAMEELGQLLAALNPPTSEERKSVMERVDVDSCLATRTGSPCYCAHAHQSGDAAHLGGDRGRHSHVRAHSRYDRRHTLGWWEPSQQVAQA